ncbi:hypothetical protein JL721_8323 [Aureococcus anophagefferens]|nr:hypothetical protein JL721_8323 [Aureococcus anophagefferens]
MTTARSATPSRRPDSAGARRRPARARRSKPRSPRSRRADPRQDSRTNVTRPGAPAPRFGARAGRGALDVREQFVLFDGNAPHSTIPFAGARYTLIFFTHASQYALPEGERAYCDALGFPMPHSSASRPTCARPRSGSWRAQRVQRLPVDKALVDYILKSPHNPDIKPPKKPPHKPAAQKPAPGPTAKPAAQRPPPAPLPVHAASPPAPAPAAAPAAAYAVGDVVSQADRPDLPLTVARRRGASSAPRRESGQWRGHEVTVPAADLVRFGAGLGPRRRPGRGGPAARSASPLTGGARRAQRRGERAPAPARPASPRPGRRPRAAALTPTKPGDGGSAPAAAVAPVTPAAPAAPAPASAELGDGWWEKRDPATGRCYYVHEITAACQWERPDILRQRRRPLRRACRARAPPLVADAPEPSLDELSNENVVRIVREECGDDEVNALVWNKDVDEPVLRANQALVASIPMKYKGGIKEHLRAVGWTGYKLEGLTPEQGAAQCANWLSTTARPSSA